MDKTLGQAIADGNWQTRQEARKEWSVYRGMAYVKGPFRTQSDAQAWLDDHVSKMMEVGAA
jgi:hypothetical protein